MAWPAGALPVETLDATSWGPPLRFSAPARLMEEFYQEIGAKLPRFLVYGSGDFHHLTALWVRQLPEPFVLVSFDNHPDWDVRPPRWCCGGWVNRALDLPLVKKVSVWGCGISSVGGRGGSSAIGARNGRESWRFIVGQMAGRPRLRLDPERSSLRSGSTGSRSSPMPWMDRIFTSRSISIV